MNNKTITRRRSKQRERIFALLSARKDHPTAADLYQQLRGEMPTASLGNVYRNIRILVEQNKVRVLEFGAETEHFDANTDDHCHFICEDCGAIIDIDLPARFAIPTWALRRLGLEIRKHLCRFYGTCARCRKGKNRSRARRPSNS